MSAGWYIMHRGWMASADFRPEPHSEREAYLWSIEQAAYEPHLQWFNGTQFPVGKGEFVTSLSKIGKALGWSEKRVRLFFRRMERAGKWARRGACGGAKAPTVLIVCNWEKFQTLPRREGEATGVATGEAGAEQGRSEGEEQNLNTTAGETAGEQSVSSRAPALPYSDALSIWAAFATSTGWKPLNPTLSDKRRMGLAKILKAHGLDGWRAGLQRGADSALLGGPDPPAWFNFSFVTNPENFLKLSEGNYDHQFNRDQGKRQPSGWEQAYHTAGGH